MTHDDLERLLAGRDAGEDTRLRRAIRALRDELVAPASEETAHRHLSTLSTAARVAAHAPPEPSSPTWRNRLGRLVAATTMKITIGATAAAAATGGLAATGNLPQPVTEIVAGMVSKVGVSIPRMVGGPRTHGPVAVTDDSETNGSTLASGAVSDDDEPESATSPTLRADQPPHAGDRSADSEARASESSDGEPRPTTTGATPTPTPTPTSTGNGLVAGTPPTPEPACTTGDGSAGDDNAAASESSSDTHGERVTSPTPSGQDCGGEPQPSPSPSPSDTPSPTPSSTRPPPDGDSSGSTPQDGGEEGLRSEGTTPIGGTSPTPDDPPSDDPPSEDPPSEEETQQSQPANSASPTPGTGPTQ